MAATSDTAAARTAAFGPGDASKSFFIENCPWLYKVSKVGGQSAHAALKTFDTLLMQLTKHNAASAKSGWLFNVSTKLIPEYI
jgi:hypothetical protein